MKRKRRGKEIQSIKTALEMKIALLNRVVFYFYGHYYLLFALLYNI